MSEAGLTRDEREALGELLREHFAVRTTDGDLVECGSDYGMCWHPTKADLLANDEEDAYLSHLADVIYRRATAREQAAYDRGAADVRAVIESKASQARRQDDDTLIGYYLPIEWWRSVRPESHRNRPRGDEQTSGDQLRRCPTCGTVLAASACVRCQRYVTGRRACVAVCPDGSTDDPCWASCTTNDEGASGAREGGTA